MKQAELDRLLNKLFKAAAKTKGWKTTGGFAFWRLNDLFFVLMVSANARQQKLHYTLKVKWYHLDDLFWNIMDMASNTSAPMSLRANGAFVISGEELLAASIETLEWTPGRIQNELEAMSLLAEARASEVDLTIHDIDDYLAFAEKSYAAYLARYPGAIRDLWKERLLIALGKGDRVGAMEIAQERMSANDTGSFRSNGRTFYELAVGYLTS